jgi:hypothetical protein
VTPAKYHGDRLNENDSHEVLSKAKDLFCDVYLMDITVTKLQICHKLETCKQMLLQKTLAVHEQINYVDEDQCPTN